MIGKMDKRIDLVEMVKTADGSGGYTTVATVRATVWAEFVKPRVATLQETGTVISEMAREIKIRLRTDVKKGWKIAWGLKTFDVQHVYDADRATTVLVCREVVK